MHEIDHIRARLDRELRRLAQAYLYGTPDECEARRFAVERLAAAERAAVSPRIVLPRIDPGLKPN